ncbi:5-hydroxytryptamine receptor 3A-like isoform X2 [Ascaphus truei]|uniref:5-hydroxytryptamine receptor 3A-like isoform X2 n=1 Tax=Ascaphus truei TaxID=8439 RepID=UPI003F597368
MVWFNEFAEWDPAACARVRNFSVPSGEMWIPDVFVLKLTRRVRFSQRSFGFAYIDEDKSQRTPYVYVNHTGRVRYDRMLRVVSSCNLGIFNFPFDVQNCSFTFGSYMHTVRDVRVGLAIPVDQILKNSLKYLATNGEWELLKIEGSPDILKFGIDEWDIITFWVVIRRRPILYVVNLLIPSAFLMLIDILSFFLPPHSTDRASFKMTLLLGYSVFLLIMNDLLPSTASGTPLIGIYFSVCLALLVLSLLETVIITHILHRGTRLGSSVPAWVRRLVMGLIAPLTCYRENAPPGSQDKFSNNLPPSSETGNPHNNVPGHHQPSPHHAKVSNTGHKEFLGGVPELFSPESLSPGPERYLALISRNLRRVREMLESRRELRDQEEEWVQIGYVLDSLLYRLYLIFIGSYAIIIISVWCVWYNI